MENSVSVGTDVYNMNTYAESIKLYVAMYAGNTLKNIEIINADMEESEVFHVSSDMLSVPDGCTRIKAFVWNGDYLYPVRILK